MFVAIEGVDGVGKTTVCQGLALELNGLFLPVSITSLKGNNLTKKSLSTHFLYYLIANYLNGKRAEESNFSVVDGHTLRTITSHLALGMNKHIVHGLLPFINNINKPTFNLLVSCEHNERITRLENRKKKRDQYEILSKTAEQMIKDQYKYWSTRLSYALLGLDTTNLSPNEAIQQAVLITKRYKIKERIIKESRQHFLQYGKYINNKDKVLDIGTGTGFTASFIKSRTRCCITGLDINAYSTYPIDIERKIYNGINIPYEDKSFDVSLLFYTLHHAKNPYKLFAEAIRVTEKTLIIIEEFDKSNDCAEEEAEALISIGLDPNMKHRSLKFSQMEEMIKDLGLTTVYIEQLETQSTKPVDKFLYIIIL